MAVGYHKLNTSAARSKSIQSDEIPRDKIKITPKGTEFKISNLLCVVLEDFVSDCDSVKCRSNGVIETLKGGFIRGCII